jgi:hypothetical protein
VEPGSFPKKKLSKQNGLYSGKTFRFDKITRGLGKSTHPKVFFPPPTDAQSDSLKNNFKFALKLTLKGSYMFRREKHHHYGAYYLSLA